MMYNNNMKSDSGDIQLLEYLFCCDKYFGATENQALHSTSKSAPEFISLQCAVPSNCASRELHCGSNFTN
jgi:hypothetical protein